MFDKVINEYFNIKQANIYGVYTDVFEEGEGMTQDQQANLYSKEHFYNILFCDKD